MCLINDNQEFNSIKQFLSLSVGVVPQSGLTVEAGDLSEASMEAVVEVVEGESIALTCYAHSGYPPPEVSWESNIFNESESVAVLAPVASSLPSSPLVSVTRTLLYTATLQDHNNSLACHVSQTHRQALLYSRTMRVSLAVKERRAAAPLVREMTVISGVVVITTIFLLFCLVLILLLVRHSTKRRRRSTTNLPLVYRLTTLSLTYQESKHLPFVGRLW